MSTEPDRTAFPYREPTNYDLLLTLTRVEGKLDTVHTQGADHEMRLRALEKARWPLPSLAILISIGGAIVTFWNH